MSIEALRWVEAQETGSPGTQLVLFVLANYADENGECYPALSLLAKRSQQSVDTVRRKLQVLEEQGYIERQERWRENGTRTSDRFRLLMRRAPGGDPLDVVGTLADCEGTHPGNLQGCTPASFARGTLATVLPQEPPFNPQLNNPPDPPVGGGGGEPDVGEGDGSQLDAFLTAFGEEPSAIVSRPPAARAWAKLTPVERANALAGLRAYLDHCRRHKRKVCSPATYLRDRYWDSFKAAPEPQRAAPARKLDGRSQAVAWARSAADRSRWVFVEEGSEAWREWASAFREEGAAFATGSMKMIDVGGGRYEPRRGRSFPMERPPPRGTPATDADAAE
ncbi:helix-turn-helix protein [Azorhizobium sp. AG788]|uniref:helix-turn-helix domain-containing protein n=1 Tax=Azorhizobium sp. AG788 TaxID=2183897 RepID=UPI00105B4DC2|nr:helix-turn-helix domain-containing protein [Azorhizobium sp. AG788]TDT94907.1 helix-turn-helix protein [Azorhizobium sp. AG788]